ncbi:MAG TPA: prepilin-type N-terminal cleavage/methylation domain-containing protein [Chthoniobacteraceae bacterium]|nr:prepilin-type N-terminal cleavage/methylation domain-containing protein [Chthoniobacteraceae bacterium]
MKSTIHPRSSRLPIRFRELHGFTVTELLVAIGLIAVLAVALLGLSAGLRGRSNAATCVNHLKQLALYFNVYASDHDGYYPHVARYSAGGVGQHWYYNTELLSLMQIPVSNVWKGKVPFYLCPEDQNGMSTAFGGVRVLSYGFNIAVGSGGSNGYTSGKYIRTRSSQINQPSKLLLACDASEYYLQVKSKAVPKAVYRHRGGANVAFCDGHVAWMEGPLPTSTQDPDLWWPDGVAR